MYACLSHPMHIISYLDTNIDKILGCFVIALLSLMTRFRLLVLKRCFSSGPEVTHVTVYLVSVSVYWKPWHICQYRSIGSRGICT